MIVIKTILLVTLFVALGIVALFLGYLLVIVLAFAIGRGWTRGKLETLERYYRNRKENRRVRQSAALERRMSRSTDAKRSTP